MNEVIFFFLVLAAVICAFIAVARTMKLGAVTFLNGRYVDSVSWFTVAVTLVILALLHGLGIPLGQARDLAKRTQCQSNLHSFDLALSSSCYPPNDHFPESLTDLNKDDVSPVLFICPGSGHAAGELDEGDQWSDIIYVSGIGPDGPPRAALLICPPEFHGGIGGNVLFCDHSTRWVDAERLEKLIRDPLFECESIPDGLREEITVRVSKRIELETNGKYRTHSLKDSGNIQHSTLNEEQEVTP